MERRTRNTLAIFAAATLVVCPHHADAQLDTAYDVQAGDWEIKGFILDGGHTILCNMERTASGGGTFSYMYSFTTGSNVTKVTAAFVFPTSAPDDANVDVIIGFDGQLVRHFSATAKSGYLTVEIDTGDNEALKAILDSMTSSSTLGEITVIPGQSTEAESVDLTGSKKAFDAAGVCLSTIIKTATDMMGSQN